MKACGIIAEYNPFHRGHARHLTLAREKTGADFLIAVISGSFTQRGLPALLPATVRAQMALQNGADLVLQLPYAFSAREGEAFAFGGISILESLGCVDFLSFGCEFPALEPLQKAAALLENPDEEWLSLLRQNLTQGLSHAEAAGRALDARLSLPLGSLRAPNTALALCYLRALIRLNSAMEPAPIQREHGYHALEREEYPSATAIRGSLLRGDWAGALSGIPENCYSLLISAMGRGYCPPDGLDALLMRELLFAAPEKIAALPGISEGLEQRIIKAAKEAVTREELISLIKTRRYTEGRISRALCHLTMGVTKDDFPARPSCARLLGFKAAARPLLRKIQDGGFPLITRPAREKDWQLDLRADELWHIGAHLPRSQAYRYSPVILP